MISYSEAEKILQNEFKKLTLKTEQVDLINSINRIFAEDIFSDINLPPFDNSAMDGFAIKFNPEIKKWKIIGEIPAGKFFDYKMNDYSAVSIMTGGKIPSGCDTVIPVEDIDIEKDDYIKLKVDAKFVRGLNVRKQGEDLIKGNIALQKNILLKPHHIAAAAACGKSTLKVYRKLRIGVMATGDELVDIHETPKEDKIRCSNLYSLLSAIKEINMHPVNLGITKDIKGLIRDRMKLALENDLDVLITTGGVSVGKFDYLKEIYEDLGIDIKFYRVKIKPGKPLLFGTLKKKDKTVLIFGLPGNPVSCLVNFDLFIRQNIYRMFQLDISQKFVANLKEDLYKEDRKRHFLRGSYYSGIDGKYYVKKVGSQSSGNVSEMGRANCLIIIEEERINPKKGEQVECIVL
jgi:molybdopterin molybdotransferase